MGVDRLAAMQRACVWAHIQCPVPKPEAEFQMMGAMKSYCPFECFIYRRVNVWVICSTTLVVARLTKIELMRFTRRERTHD